MPAFGFFFVDFFPDTATYYSRSSIFINMRRNNDVVYWLTDITTASQEGNSRKRSVSDVGTNAIAYRQPFDQVSAPEASGSTYQQATFNNPLPDDDSDEQLLDDSSPSTRTISADSRVVLELDSIIRRRSFDGNVPLPPELQGIASQLQRISQGQGIISAADQERLEVRPWASLWRARVLPYANADLG